MTQFLTLIATVGLFDPVTQYVGVLFRKTPFQGLYQPNAFDLAILIPYFGCLIILSVYGAHRYALIYLYLKNRRNAPEPHGEFESLPKVTVQLPIYNERYVVERLLDAVSQLDYPRDLLEIQVLDDSTDETAAVCCRLVSDYQRAGFPVTYHHRQNREGFKAGALSKGLEKTGGEFIAIFDADFVPPPAAIRQMLPYFADPSVYFVLLRLTLMIRFFSFF
ncbi:MAG: glycosyltransferase [Terriglobia bacterium]